MKLWVCYVHYYREYSMISTPQIPTNDTPSTHYMVTPHAPRKTSKMTAITADMHEDDCGNISKKLEYVEQDRDNRSLKFSIEDLVIKEEK